MTVKCWEVSDKEVPATVTYRDDISGEVKQNQGKVLLSKKLLGASVYREEKHDKHYKHCVTFGSIYVNTATSGRSKTSKGNESFLALLRILGLFLCLPTWRVQFYTLGYKVTALKAALVLLGSVLVLSDYSTDVLTGVEHIQQGDIFWGSLTLAIPLFNGLLSFTFLSSRPAEKRSCLCIRSVIRCICWTVFCPYLMAREFFKNIFEPNSAVIRKTKENTQIAKNIFREKHQQSLNFKHTEAFVEAASQLFLQLYIIFSRGYFTSTQAVSITLSIISLSLASADNHFSCQSLATENSILRKAKIIPFFVIIIIARVLGFSFFCTFSALGIYDVPILIPVIFIGNILINILLKKRTNLTFMEMFFSSITCFWTTSLKLAPSSKRIALGELLLFYTTQTIFASILGIIGCFLLEFYHIPRSVSDLPLTSNYLLLPFEDHFQVMVIFLILLQLLPSVIASLFYLTQANGRGITLETCTGKIQIPVTNEMEEFTSDVVTGTKGSQNFSNMVPGSSSDILSVGTSVRVSTFAIIGDTDFNELTMCRFDKFVVLPWRQDEYHNKNVWMKVRIISVWYTQEIRSMRYNITTQPTVGTEGYIPSHLSFYDVIQMFPLEKWWWQPALELTGLQLKIKVKLEKIKCGVKRGRPAQLDYLLGKGGCSQVFSEPVPQISFVCMDESCEDKARFSFTEHSCQDDCKKSCTNLWLCGWCSVTCHAEHCTRAVLDEITWDNSKADKYNRTPWTGRTFMCSCSCQPRQEEEKYLIENSNNSEV
eukprot:GFUD01045343.1.p1 GENE.GFUD01045343.1~~GFUD01045343.1.p1  ORF type:complete len:767 (+),score=137.51 GFUD01045343.1:201-2501(+)